MAAYVFHRVLHMFQGGNIDTLSGSLTNNGMVPASIFDNIDAFQVEIYQYSAAA